MEYLSNRKGFLGTENKFNKKEKAVVVPFGLEKTVSYGSGTKNGPKEIIKASHQVELFDEDLNCEPYKKIGIKTLKPFTIKKSMKDALNQIAKINSVLIKQKLFPMVLGGVILYASYYGCDQSEAQRALSAKSESDLKKMMLANGIFRFPITLLYCLAGLVVGTLAFNDANLLSQIPKDNPDWLMPVFILNYLPHGLIGLLVVAILAAAMSSLSSAINSLAAVSLEDYFKLTRKRAKPEGYLNHAKFAGLLWGGIILLLSLNAGDIAPTVIEAVNKVGSVFFGPVLAVFLLGMLTKKINATQVNTGLMCGVLTNLSFAFFVEDVFWFWWNVTGFASTVIPAIILSVLSANDENDTATITTSGQRRLLIDKPIATLLLGYFCLLVVVCYLIPRWLQ